MVKVIESRPLLLKFFRDNQPLFSNSFDEVVKNKGVDLSNHHLRGIELPSEFQGYFYSAHGWRNSDRFIGYISPNHPQGSYYGRWKDGKGWVDEPSTVKGGWEGNKRSWGAGGVFYDITSMILKSNIFINWLDKNPLEVKG